MLQISSRDYTMYVEKQQRESVRLGLKAVYFEE